jgi:tRNA (mo5U34)-methyltransferase
LNLEEELQDLENWPIDIARDRLSDRKNGNYIRWNEAYKRLPEMTVASSSYSDTVSILGEVHDEEKLLCCLEALRPWRKGPFKIGNTFIDTEWRSDWKWGRVISSKKIRNKLKNARVLDVGCGNGYFGWRMLGSGARRVVGIDPSALFCIQHQCMRKYLDDTRNSVLPLKIEDIPENKQFDCVFSMGVIYHRKDPVDHLTRLHRVTRDSGLLILETLIQEGNNSLYPKGRYARMGNVSCVPCESDLFDWIRQAGFRDPERIDRTRTSVAEQRTTDWMKFESLSESLDRHNSALTVEGLQAPIREIIIAKK